MSKHGRRPSGIQGEAILPDSLDDLDYKAEGGWFPVVSSLVRWLGNAGCNEYVSPGVREAVYLTHFPTLESEMAMLQRTMAFLARICNDPPPHLSSTQRQELRVLRHRAVLFVQHRLRQLAKDEEQSERVAKILKQRLQVAEGLDAALSEEYLAAVSGNVRLERRTLSEEEFALFVAAAHKSEGSLTWQTKRGAKTSSKTIRVPSGPDRVMLYTLAAFVGFCASEMASLTPESFDLDSEPPSVTVEAAYSKRRRKDTQPLRPDLADRVRAWLRNKPASERLWPGNWWKHAARMVRADLDAARAAWISKAGDDPGDRERREQSCVLAYRNEAGQVFDFHAFRHQFISNLAAAGVHPKVGQTLARHSTITLTMDRYTHIGQFDQTAALEKLPGLPAVEPDEGETVLQATGTCPVRTRFVQITRSQECSGTSMPCRAPRKEEGTSKTEIMPLQGIANDCGRLRMDEGEEAPPGFEPGMADLQSAAPSLQHTVG
jgi:integrase